MENNTTSDFKQAKDEIEAICKKYGIVLIPVVVHQGNRTASSIEIVPVTALDQSEGGSVPSQA